MRTTEDTVEIPLRLNVDTHAAPYAKAMAELDNVATKKLNRVGLLVAETHVPAEADDAVAADFSADKDVAALLALIVSVNVRNAMGIAARAWEPGSYQP